MQPRRRITPQNPSEKPLFLLDSGATNHFSNDITLFTTYRKLSPPLAIASGNKQDMKAVGKGTIFLNIPNENCPFILELSHVYFVTLSSSEVKGTKSHM